VLAIAGLITLVIAGSARAGSSDCELYDSAYEKAPLFEVKPAGSQRRVYLYSRPNNCADLKTCTARKRIYLVPGDVVFAGPEDHGFRCAYYGSARGILVAGFLPAAKLHPISGQDDLSADFLIGKWQSSLGPHLTPNSITIVNGGPGKVNAAGEAYYQTAQTVNEGSFGSAGVTVTPGAKEVVFRQGSGDIACAVTVRRRGPYLVVDDNGNCGGLNVTFRGIYVRLRGK
jgi:hypothetical protein